MEDTGKVEESRDTITDTSAMSDEDVEAALAAETTTPDVEEPEPDAGEKVAEEKEEPGVEGQKADAPPEGDTIALSKAEYEKVQKQIAEKEAMIQRLGNKLGEFRRTANSAPQQPPPNAPYSGLTDEQLHAQFSVDPVGATREVQRRMAVEEEMHRAELDAMVRANKQTVMQAHPDFDGLLDDIVALAKEDGEAEDDIEAFKVNPYAVNPFIVINYAHRAKLKRAIADREAEIAKLKSAPQEALKKLAQASNSKKITNASGAPGGTPKPIDMSQVAMMSDAELDAALEERQKGG